MTQLSTISGPVSNLRTISSTHGSMSQGSGSVSTSHRLTMRVGTRPAFTSIMANLTDGDLVTLAGNGAGGEFEAFALRNDTTNVIYYAETKMTTLGSYALYALGVMTLAIFVGIAFIGMGYWVGRIAKQRRESNALLDAAPRAAQPAT